MKVLRTDGVRFVIIDALFSIGFIVMEKKYLLWVNDCIFINVIIHKMLTFRLAKS